MSDQEERQPADRPPQPADHIHTGDISHSGAVAVGRGATAVYQGLSYEEVVALFGTLRDENQPDLWDGRVPYLGLKAFQESDAEFFFGRQELVEQLLGRVAEGSRFLVIAGPSGSGKSSVARAGLLYALGEGRIERSEKWLRAAFSPKEDPVEELAQAFARLTGSPNAGDYLRQHGRIVPDQPDSYDPLALHKQAEALLSDDATQRLVLLVDQFEELFTQTRDVNAREAFIGLLTAAAGAADGRTLIVISLRSDFLSNCALYPALREQINRHNQFQLVGAMAPRDLAKAITLPALQVGAAIDPALVKRIIDDMKGEPGALPLMSFALRDLFLAEKTQKNQRMDLTLPEYVNRGGIEQALEHHADNVFATFTPQECDLARGIFSKLITVGEGRLDTRRTALFEELTPAGSDAAAVAAVVATLAAEGVRLVTTSGVENGEELTPAQLAASPVTVTIAHEKLIDAWPWLRQLIDENRQLIALQNRIQRDARDWSALEDPGFLYRGGRLLNVEENLAALEPSLDALSQRFLQASIAQREAEARAEEERIRQGEALRQEKANAGRFRRLTKWLTVAAVIAVIATLVALFFMNTARGEADLAATSEAEALAAEEAANENARLLSTSEAQARAAESEANDSAKLAATREAEARAAEGEARDAQLEIADLKNRIQASQLAAASAVALEDDQELALLLASAGLGLNPQADTIARFYDAAFTPFRHSLNGHKGLVLAASFSPDGQRMVTASDDGSAKVWNLDGEELASLEGHEATVRLASFSPDGERILTASDDGSAKVWDLNGQEFASLEGHEGIIRSASFSPDGERILTASDDGAKVWDLDGEELASLEGHEGNVRSASFSPDGERILTASDDGANLWDLAGNEQASLDGHESFLNSASFSPDGDRIATTGNDGSAKVWDLGGNELVSLDGHKGIVWSASFSSGGQLIVTAGGDSPKLWSVAGSEEVSLEGHGGSVRSASYSPNGQRIVTAGGGSATLWDLAGNELASFEGHTAPVWSASFSPDGERIVTASADGSIRVWDLAGEELASLRGRSERVISASFSPKGKYLLIAGCVQNDEVDACLAGSAEVLDLDGRLQASLVGHKDWVNSASFSPDGEHIVTASEDGSAKLWDLAGNELASLEGHGLGVNSASFSPDGEHIVTASEDGSAKLWDLAGNELASLEGHTAPVRSASFGQDGEHIVTASLDGSARIWDLVGEELASLELHEGAIASASFSPDGQHIVTASEDGSARVWPVYPALASNVVRARLGSEGEAFSEQQCQQFFPADDQESCPQTMEALLALLDDDG